MKTTLAAAFADMRAQLANTGFVTILDRLESDERMQGAWSEVVPNPVAEDDLFKLLEAVRHAHFAAFYGSDNEQAARDAETEYAKFTTSIGDISRLLERVSQSRPGQNEEYDARLLELHDRLPDLIRALHEVGEFIVLMQEGTQRALSQILPSSRKKVAHPDTVFAVRLCSILDELFCDSCPEFVAVVTSVVFDSEVLELRDPESIRKAWVRDRDRRAVPPDGSRP